MKNLYAVSLMLVLLLASASNVLAYENINLVAIKPDSKPEKTMPARDEITGTPTPKFEYADKLIKKLEDKAENATREANLKDQNYMEKIVNGQKVFFVKGAISSYNTTSFVINGKTVTIDKTVTKDIKIEGDLKNGMYAMVQGNIVNNKLYATKIIVNNRYKHEFDSDRDATKSAHLTPTPKYKKSAEQRVQKIEDLIKRLQDILTTLKNKI